MKHCLFILLIIASVNSFAQMREASVLVAGESLVFSGFIANRAVDDALALAETNSIQRLIISSPGGELRAGLRLGNWVAKSGATVVVSKLCMSTCANYVFPAGKQKVIQTGALVVWHGSAEQRNFRERDEKYFALVSKAKTTALESDEAAFLQKNEKIVERSLQVRALQKEFFRQIGVDEYLTRLGQEPDEYGASWTVPIPAMKRFGIQNVSGPEGYGLPNYIESAFPKSGLRSKPVSVDFVAAKDGRVAPVILTQ